MSKMFFKMGLGVLAIVGLVWPSYAAVQGRTTLTGHVPAVVSQLASTGQLVGSTNLHLAIGLPLRNQAALNLLLQQVNDPASTNYQKYLSAAEFTAQFGPTTDDVQAVSNFANAHGLTVTRTHANRMIVEVSGAVSDVEHTFNVTLKTYQHPTENRVFYSPTAEPSVPAGLPVLDIGGLSSYAKPHPFIKVKPSTPNGAFASSLTGSAPDGSGNYFGNDFHKAYVPGTTLTGAGQKIALLQFDGYFPSDIAAYAQAAGLPALSITNILLDGFNGIPTLTGGEVEVELDIEMVNAMAPGSQLLVYEENPNVFNPVVILNQIATDNIAKQIGCSWSFGIAPNGSGTINQILQQMILQGQSFLQASGDSDAMLPGQADTSFFGICCNPFVTSVGGTKLATDAGGNYLSESVWNDHVPNVGQGNYYGSGGGVSTFYTTPSWQQGFGNANNHGSTTGRNFPDVAFTATDIYIIYDNGQTGAVGGTSCAAPLWAGFMALVNQQGALNGRPPVGFLNPAIYALAHTGAYTNYFRDTTIGDNTWPGSPTNFFAVTGYDLATGLGTPRGTNLIFALTGVTNIVSGPIISAPRAPWGTTLGVMNGGNPNGFWYLFVQDDKPLDTGVISNGWAVTLTSANPVGFASDNLMFASPTNANVNLGGNWTVTYSVTNYGPSIATNILVTDDMPIGAGLAFVGAVPSVGSLSQLGSTLLWNIPTLAINAGAQLNVTFNATVLGIYTNSVTVSGAGDPNPDDDTAVAYANVAVFSPPAFSSVTFTNGRPTISVTNAGAPMSVIIQANTNLANPFSWLPIYTNTTPFSFTDLNATNYPYRFYRSLLGP